MIRTLSSTIHGNLNTITLITSVDDLAMFLDMGADINATDHHGYTPLFYAAMSNNANTAATLIRRGADLEVRGSACRRSVLHIAAMYGSNDVIKILLDKVRTDDVIKILL